MPFTIFFNCVPTCKPGITVNEEVFLDYNLVTVEWEVTEITIEDKYEITLNTTFVTDVPAAVVIIEPASVILPDMKAGDVYNGEFTLTNHGLIRADNLDVTLPASDSNFKFELMDGLPESVPAKESVTVSYKVTSLVSLDQEDDGTGGGCYSYRRCGNATYSYLCAGGITTEGSASTCWTRTYGNDCGGSSSGGTPPVITSDSGGTSNVSGGSSGSGGTTSVKPSPSASQMSGTKCLFDCDLMAWMFDKFRAAKETYMNFKQKVGCSVNTVARLFTDEEIDLMIKVPGGTIRVEREFRQNQWMWNHENRLTFHILTRTIYRGGPTLGTNAPDPGLSSLPPGISSLPCKFFDSIDKDGVFYKGGHLSAQSSPIPDEDYLLRTTYTHFRNGTYKIDLVEDDRYQDGIYRWEDRLGNWRIYEGHNNHMYTTASRMLSFGNLSGVVGKMLYDEETGELTGIVDRNDNQVVWFEHDTDGNISAIYDAENRRVEYTYTDGRLTTVKDVLENETNYAYDENGYMTQKTDAEGRETIVTYDDSQVIKSVTDSQGTGHFFSFDYDKSKGEWYAQTKTTSGRVKEVWYNYLGETKRVAINGRTVQAIEIDDRDLIITDEKGNVTRKEFDEWDNLKKIVYPNGEQASFEYDLRFNKVSKITDPLGNITEFGYDDNGNLIQKTEASGTGIAQVTSYVYDDDNQLLSATLEGETDAEDITSTFTYDAAGNLETITDPEQNVTRFVEYNNMGNLLRMIDPRGYEWTFAYDDMGRLISQTDPLTNTTTYEYDGANNRTAIINALLKRFDFEYDDHNNLIKAIDPYEKYINTEYNTDNLPTRIFDQEGKSFESRYDNEGRLIKTIDGAGNEITYHYDETSATPAASSLLVRIEYPTYTQRFYYDTLQRVIREEDDLRNGTTYSRSIEYDAAGNMISNTDEQGKATRFEYDALNRLTKSIDPMTNEIKRKYDNRGNLIELQDPNTGITFYEYDKNNRMTKVIRPMLQETAYEYDAVGNRTAVVDTKGQRIEYTYNAINRMTQVRYYAAGDHVNPIKTVDFTYDALGNIKTYNDGTTSATYTYDDLQRKTGESVNYGAFTLDYSYTYWANGLKKTFTGPDGTTVDYSYDDNNRLAGVAIPGQGQITYNYDPAHWNSPARMVLPGGGMTEYTYDPLMQVKSIIAKDPGQNPVMTREYAYSQAGNITQKNTEHGAYGYQYDDLYRLTQAANPTLPDEVYTYDALGNRLTSAATTGPWTYNANNELQGFDTTAFNYDGNGNMVQKTVDGTVSRFTYDPEDRLTEVRDGADQLIASYYYDPFGRRLWKEVDGTKTYYLYSDEGLIGEYNNTGAEIKTYGWVPDSVWGTDPLFVKSEGTYYWYRNDIQGTPQKLTRTNGSVAWSATYDSFGNCQVDVEEIESNLRFAGQYFDEETGLYYNWNRYYDPTIGRYLKVDPYGDGLNLYAYVYNNPNAFIDPLGLCKVEKVWDWWSDLVTIDLDFLNKPIEIEVNIDFGPRAATLGPFIFYFEPYTTSPDTIKGAIRLHELIHYYQTDHFTTNLTDALKGEYSSLEMEAYKATLGYINLKLLNSALSTDERRILEKERGDLEWMLENPQYMWSKPMRKLSEYMKKKKKK